MKQYLIKPYKNLMVAILRQALVDARNTHEKYYVRKFAHSDFCQQLCQETDIDYYTYLNKIEKRCNM